VTTDASQFQRTCLDVADYLCKHARIPSAVGLGSQPEPPEAYLAALARIGRTRPDGQARPESIAFNQANSGVARPVTDDDPTPLRDIVFGVHASEISGRCSVSSRALEELAVV